MKKLIFIMLAVFTFSFVNAQDMSMGVKAGINYGANKTSDDDYNDNFDPMMGINLGVYAEFELSDKFSVQPELMYTQSGANGKDRKITKEMALGPAGIKDVKVDIKNDVKLRLNYLSIPVMAKYYVTDGLSLEAGPYLSFLLSAKQNGTFKTTAHLAEYIGEDRVDETKYDNKDMKDDYKSMDFGMGFGAGYKMDNGLSFALRYNLGLMDINDSKEKTGEASTTKKGGKLGTKDFSMANNIIQLSVGYKFM